MCSTQLGLCGGTPNRTNPPTLTKNSFNAGALSSHNYQAARSSGFFFGMEFEPDAGLRGQGDKGQLSPTARSGDGPDSGEPDPKVTVTLTKSRRLRAPCGAVDYSTGCLPATKKRIWMGVIGKERRGARHGLDPGRRDFAAAPCTRIRGQSSRPPTAGPAPTPPPSQPLRLVGGLSPRGFPGPQSYIGFICRIVCKMASIVVLVFFQEEEEAGRNIKTFNHPP